jgi:hypothetical protein
MPELHDSPPSQRCPLFHDRRTLQGHFGVERDELALVCGHIVFGENRLDRAFRNARVAANALFGIDIEHLISFPKRFNRAGDNAIRVFAAKASARDDVSHGKRSEKCDWSYVVNAKRRRGPDKKIYSR